MENIDEEKAGRLVKSSSLVLRAASELAAVTADIVDGEVVEEMKASELAKKEKRKGQVRAAQATSREKSRLEAEAQSQKLIQLQAEVDAFAEIRKEQAALHIGMRKAEKAAAVWRAAAGGLLFVVLALLFAYLSQ